MFREEERGVGERSLAEENLVEFLVSETKIRTIRKVERRGGEERGMEKTVEEGGGCAHTHEGCATHTRVLVAR